MARGARPGRRPGPRDRRRRRRGRRAIDARPADVERARLARRQRPRRLDPGTTRRTPGAGGSEPDAAPGRRRATGSPRRVDPDRPVAGDARDADLPPGRALPAAFRRGLSRTDGHGVPAGLAVRRVPRHLRVDPSAPRQVRDGRGTGAVGRGPRLGDRRSGHAGRGGRHRATTGRPADRRASGRAPPPGDRRRDPDRGPADAPDRQHVRGPGLDGAGHRRTRRSSS